MKNNKNQILLHVLGCGDAFGSGGRLNTCFHVDNGSVQFLIDCGATTLSALKKYGYTTNDIDFILITHFHGDHFGGIPNILLDAALIAKRRKKLVIATPKGGKHKIFRLLEQLYPGATKTVNSLNLEFLEYGQTPFSIKNVQVIAFKVKHSKPSLPHALRIETRKKLITYSGDTEWVETLIPASDQADLFICECYNYNEQIPAHMNYQTLARKLKSLNCKRLLLTHLGDEMLKKEKRLKIKSLSEGLKILI